MNFLNKIKNGFSDSFNWVSGDIAIDLGTANTLIWLAGKGIIINEPSIIARSTKTGNVIAVGDDAKQMLGKTHEGIETIRPLRDGVIADYTAVDEMLQGFIRKVNLNRLTRPRMVICVPSGVTEVERRAVKDSGEKQAAREVFLVDEPVAAAIGIGLDISKPVGNIIVDIGGGTTEVAVISLNGVVTKKAIRVAGDEMDDAIQHWFRNEHKLEIGAQTAEQIKITVGSAMRSRSKNILVKGRDLVSGIPKTIDIRSDEIRQALKDPVKRILDVIKDALEATPAELSSDIIDRGIVLAGGGSQLRGLDQVLREKTGVPVNVADEPHLAIVKGCGSVIEDLEKFKHVLL
jgi:rod shape-determining protein MreB